MIGESFQVKNKPYTVIKPFTVGDKRKINTLQSKFNDLLGKDLKDDIIIEEQTRLSNEQDDLMVELLKKILGLNDDTLNKLSYPDELIEVFQTMITTVGNPKKKELKPSDLPISQEIQTYPK